MVSWLEVTGHRIQDLLAAADDALLREQSDHHQAAAAVDRFRSTVYSLKKWTLDHPCPDPAFGDRFELLLARYRFISLITDNQRSALPTVRPYPRQPIVSASSMTTSGPSSTTWKRTKGRSDSEPLGCAGEPRACRGCRSERPRGHRCSSDEAAPLGSGYSSLLPHCRASWPLTCPRSREPPTM